MSRAASKAGNRYVPTVAGVCELRPGRILGPSWIWTSWETEGAEVAEEGREYTYRRVPVEPASHRITYGDDDGGTAISVVPGIISGGAVISVPPPISGYAGERI